MRLFVATKESILFYGVKTSTMTKFLKKQLDGFNPRMLRMTLNVSESSHTTNTELYSELQKITSKEQQREMLLEGHCIRYYDEVATFPAAKQGKSMKRRTRCENAQVG